MMDLIDRSLVMVAKRRSTGKVKTCNIHDLLHEFCVAKAKEENYLHLLHGYDCSTFNESSNTHRLSIHSKQEQFQKLKLFCPRLHCLLFFGYKAGSYSFSLTSHLSFTCSNFLECWIWGNLI
ncbi:hypothetical protein ACH5RR_021281 [Cinchona calisaya]|uniref:Uncharacterized protein n=1 Tax=Cinchona calisaya TaxID=153742 RepID=A0ABD2ZJR0_9GENT